MSKELDEGVQLEAIWLPSPDGSERLGRGNGCLEIVVKMQRGQCGMVPWALVLYEEDSPFNTTLVNLALAESVEFYSPPSTPTAKGEA